MKFNSKLIFILMVLLTLTILVACKSNITPGGIPTPTRSPDETTAKPITLPYVTTTAKTGANGEPVTTTEAPEIIITMPAFTTTKAKVTTKATLAGFVTTTTNATPSPTTTKKPATTTTAKPATTTTSAPASSTTASSAATTTAKPATTTKPVVTTDNPNDWTTPIK